MHLPPSATERRVITIFRERFERDMAPTSLAVATPLIEHGVSLDSMNALELVVMLEDAFDIEFDDDDLTPALFQSIASIAAGVDRKLGLGTPP